MNNQGQVEKIDEYMAVAGKQLQSEIKEHGDSRRREIFDQAAAIAGMCREHNVSYRDYDFLYGIYVTMVLASPFCRMPLVGTVMSMHVNDIGTALAALHDYEDEVLEVLEEAEREHEKSKAQAQA